MGQAAHCSSAGQFRVGLIIEVRQVIARIEAAWRSKQFTGPEMCFHEDAVIVGPGYVEYARGRGKCAESYR